MVYKGRDTGEKTLERRARQEDRGYTSWEKGQKERYREGDIEGERKIERARGGYRYRRGAFSGAGAALRDDLLLVTSANGEARTVAEESNSTENNGRGRRIMRAVETLRQRVSLNMGSAGAQGYTPVHPSDSEDFDGDGSDYEFGGGGDEFSEGSRTRGRSGGRGSSGGGRRSGREEDLLWPPYTPLYTNMKVLRRKRLDASMVYYRAGKCKCTESSAPECIFLAQTRALPAFSSFYMLLYTPPPVLCHVSVDLSLYISQHRVSLLHPVGLAVI